MEECKLASLSHLPMRMVNSTKLSQSNSQSESLPDSINCLSSASSGAVVKAESVIGSTDYKWVEPKATLTRCDNMEERTEWKTVYRFTKEERDRLSNMKVEEGCKERQSVKMEREEWLTREKKGRLCNMKQEVEEFEEWQSVKMEREDGVRDAGGMLGEQEKARDEQKGKGVTDLTCQTHKFEKNGVKSEYSQQDMEEGSHLVTACLLKQPRVLIRRMEITGNSVLESPHPCPFARKEDQGVRSRQRLHKLSPMKGKRSLRQKGQVLTWKREMIGQLARPQKHLPATSENG